MYLKSVTLKGFKSFPDRTRLEFGPGVSVIVGPNGSGKSNVTDAVLWALGEQSPLAVRGQSMQDVIFSGAPGRKAATGAEIELVLDDSEGTLGLGAPEVSIVRRLERSGEGEYRLAGARCRLVDVIELLSDTGLGKEMHSVISQGRVEAIVTSKPRDRRLLIEEAAGLGKHRKRRRRAQLKLARTQDNLDRALDVEREARSRLRPLKRHAEAAEQHARLERQLLEARWELARDALRLRGQALNDAEAAAAQARARREAAEAELRTVARRREAAEEALSARSAQREELSRRVFAARSAGERLGYRGEAVAGAARVVADRLSRQRAQLAALREEDAADVVDPAAAARAAALQATLESLDRDREAELSRQLAELEAQLEAAGTELATRDAVIQRSRETREQAERALEAARAGVREAERGVEGARREAARIGGELAAVNQFLRSHGSPPGGAPALAGQLEVEPGLELALAAALDGRLRAAVVEDRDQGDAVLARAGADGAVALVVDSPHADAPPAAGAAAPTADARRLADLVRGPDRVLGLARNLLRDVWVVEALDGVPPSFTGTAVTPAGRVWNASARELRQAPRAGEERILEQRNRREELLARTEAAARAELAAGERVQAAAAEMSRLEATFEAALAADRAAVRERDEVLEAQRRLLAQVERRRSAPDDGPAAARRAQVVAELAGERRALEQAERERAQRRRSIDALDAGVQRDADLVPLIEELRSAIAAAAAAIAEQRTAFEQALAADREASAHVTAELKACAQEEAALHTRLHRDNEILTAAEVTLERARDHRQEAEHELHALAARLELTAEPAEETLPEDARAALHTRVERLNRRREQLGPVNPLAQEEYAEALEHVEQLEAQRTDLETALRELRGLIAETDRQIRETFEQTFDAAARNFEELASQLFPGGRGRLRLVDDRDGGPAPVLGGAPAGDAGASAEAGGEDDEADEETAGGEPPEDLMGVEIEITPAGKDMKRLTLLSGGEKSMTALAFLFSVFLAKPCPFYILDEVEAALDDLNIDRFLELLRQYSQRAQFIVVTHQKRTMEAADSLYGVSMGGDGISKVISRRLPPAVAEAAGEAAQAANAGAAEAA